jgi:hypothetical protein
MYHLCITLRLSWWKNVIACVYRFWNMECCVNDFVFLYMNIRDQITCWIPQIGVFFLMNYAFDDLRSYNIYWIIIKCILWMIELWICDESGSCRGWCARWSSLSKQGERIICQGLWSGGVFLYEPVSRVEEGV